MYSSWPPYGVMTVCDNRPSIVGITHGLYPPSGLVLWFINHGGGPQIGDLMGCKSSWFWMNVPFSLNSISGGLSLFLFGYVDRLVCSIFYKYHWWVLHNIGNYERCLGGTPTL